MYIRRIKRGDRVYLAEYKSIREGKKVKSQFIRYVGVEGADGKSEKPRKGVLDRIKHERSYQSGDVRLAWELAKRLNCVDTIDRICCGNDQVSGISPGKLITIWAINRLIDPESATQLSDWVKTTDLPHISGIPPEDFTKDAFLSALDFICSQNERTGRPTDLTSQIDDTLYQNWRHEYPLPPGERETLAYDLTSILFFGVTCPLAVTGHNSKHSRMKQANVAVVVSKYDHHPIAHFVYPGNRQSISTVKNLIARLSDIALQPGTMIWDRGNTSQESVTSIEDLKWNIICGVPKTSNDARSLIRSTDVPVFPNNLVKSTPKGDLYAITVNGHLYGKMRDVVIYKNLQRSSRDLTRRNETLRSLVGDLDKVKHELQDFTDEEIYRKIEEMAGTCFPFLLITITRNCGKASISLSFDEKALEDAQEMDGKWLLYATDSSLSAAEVVTQYLEKDFVEKVFRCLKTEEDIAPVRHRLEQRVRAYIFICMLAFRLQSVLQALLDAKPEKKRKNKKKNTIPKRAHEVLSTLKRVERVEVKLGNQVKTWYLNLPGNLDDLFNHIGMPYLFEEQVRIEM